MTYEKHIKNLQYLYGRLCKDEDHLRQTLDAAIELMCAAEPKDAAAEREHCINACSVVFFGAQTPEDQLMCGRAQARAEGYAAGRADQAKVPCVQHGDQLTLREQLAAAQAEIEVLRKAPQVERKIADDLAHQLAATKEELAAAQAEIAHWRRELERLQLAVASGVYRDEISELSTKLTNLLAAAERVDQEGWRLAGCTRETLSALRAAIEASKS